MKILVTGTAGFIGFHLAQHLLTEGHEVVGYDNFNSYYPVILKRARNAELKKFPGFKSYEGSLSDYETMSGVVAKEKPEAFCHLAGQAGVRWSIERPFEYQRSNLDGFLSVLETCRHGGIKRLVYASSSSVYGNNTKLPFSETDRVDNPISLYAATKKANELMAHTYTHLYGLQTIGLRFFTVYGPWGRPDMAMWLFADAITQGKPIRVFNHGQMKRDFTYVDDIVSGVSAAIFSQALDPYEVINLGNHRSENLMDLIKEVGKNLGVEPEMELLPMQPGDVPATFADISRAQAKLNFHPKTSMPEGVAQFVQWFLSHSELVAQIRADQKSGEK